jgi:hypothetical protein
LDGALVGVGSVWPICWTIQKSYSILHGDFMLDYNVQTSLMTNIFKIYDHG